MNGTSLRVLVLSDNRLSGNLGAFLGIRSLQTLFLSNNSFSGFLTADLTALVNLEVLDLSYNRVRVRLFPEGLPVFAPSIQQMLLANNSLGFRVTPTSNCPARVSSLNILDLKAHRKLDGDGFCHALLRQVVDGTRGRRGRS